MELSDVHLPPPVVPGDRVGVAAISGPVRSERLEAGLAALEAMGFEAVPAANLAVCTEDGLWAGTDAERLAAFHELAADESVKAIFFARGGSGVHRLLPDFDWDLLRRHPRAYVGYSDLTPFLLQVVHRLRLVAFHGPMAAADLARGLSRAERRHLLAALAGRFPLKLKVAAGEGKRCRGPLLGGCLSLLSGLLGTPYAPDYDGAVVFLEEVHEPLYRFDRLLTHLRLSGSLAGIVGLVAGHLEGVDGAGTKERQGTHRAIASVRELAEAVGASFAWGLDAGHSRPNHTLPLGILAELDPAGRRLVLGPEDSGMRKVRS